MADICITLGIIIIVFWWIMPFWVYLDAKKLGEQRPFLWAIASYFIPIVFIYWLLIRMDKKKKGRNE